MSTSCVVKNLNPPETQNVEVFCRIKPLASEGTSCLEICDEKTIKSFSSRSGTRKETLHVFTSIIPPHSGQENVFRKVALPMVADFLQGKNGLLFTYGVTGSGKTYSMEGSPKNPGILPRSLDVIFNSVGQCQTKKYVVKPDGANGFIIQSEADALVDRHRYDFQQRSRISKPDVRSVNRGERNCESTSVEVPWKSLFAVFVSFIEVYNNNIYDLLQDVSDIPGRNLTTRILREDTHRNVYVHGGVEVEVKSPEEALDVFCTGQKRRRVGQTALNLESSRSHCVFNIRLVRTGYDVKYNEAVQDKESVIISQLCLVDLAGSERTSRSGTQGNRLKEASNINNSLMNLRKCIKALRDIQTNGIRSRGNATTPGGQTRVVPYRDARLTYLFKNFFEGDGRVAMLVCVHQAPEEYEETMHVLKFAETSQEVTTYRTIVQPISVRPLYDHHHPRIQPPSRTSDNCSSTPENSVATVNIDDQSTQIFNDLEYLDSEITSCIEKMSDGDGFMELGLDFDITDFDDADIRACLDLEPLGCDLSFSDSEQTSTPLPNKLPGHLLDLKMFGTSHLRTLLNQRIKRRKQAHDSLQALFPSLQSLFNELLNSENRASAEVITSNNTKPEKNLVSVLSKQWESRLAQQQAEARTLPRPKNTKVGERFGVALSKTVDRRAAPAFNPRHRRSQSVCGDGGRWLEHQELNATPLGTVFTPVLKHRKSVTRVELKDTLNADNYLLHHQEADPNGNIETQLFKGSIIPTAGGGSAVVFNDVEVLRQSSPGREQRNGTSVKTDNNDHRQRTSTIHHRSGMKRSYSHSPPNKKLSCESVSTQGSYNSQTTGSSAYCPISPPVKTTAEAIDDATIEARCRIGMNNRGGMGCQASPVKCSSRKRSRM
ncbi:unnamed protein product [Heterobilharzia americana]|nr:unnamed protein product [Heterobilharzia americana]